MHRCRVTGPLCSHACTATESLTGQTCSVCGIELLPAKLLMLRFTIHPTVAEAYRYALRNFRVIFVKDRCGNRMARMKLKYFIRENPENIQPNELAQQVKDVAEAMRQAVVQAERNPSRGSWKLHVRPENMVDGRVELNRAPQTTLFRVQKFIKNIFASKTTKDSTTSQQSIEEQSPHQRRFET